MLRAKQGPGWKERPKVVEVVSRQDRLNIVSIGENAICNSKFIFILSPLLF